MTQITIKFKYIALTGLSCIGKHTFFLNHCCCNIFLVVVLIIFLKNITTKPKPEGNSTDKWKFPEDLDHASYLLNEAYKKIEALEDKIISLEGRVPKTYPDVNFLNYLKRKRILVWLSMNRTLC